jgi:protocatechuate 3,4-dioxygenase beta subunit
MSRKSESVPGARAVKSMNRRQVLEGFGALAATAACSGGDVDPPAGAAGAGVAGSPSGVGGQASGAAGQASAAAGQATNGSGGSGGQVTNASGGGGTGGGASGTTGQSAGSGGSSAGTANGGQTATGGQPAGGAGSGSAGAPSAGAPSAGAGGATGGDTLTPPPWDQVPMCTASKTDSAGQGPFLIHELEKSDDVSLVRQDIRGRYDEDAEPGVEMHLHLRILDATSSECNAKPVEGVEIYIWHTDAQGYYSGFGERGGSTEQKPDQKYNGTPNQSHLLNTDRFTRGIQTTNADGVVSFRSIFPGWYNGRDLHIHFVAFKPGSTSGGRITYSDANSGGKWLFTTQFYFEPAFSKSIHEKNEPYLRRTSLPDYAAAMAADEPNNSGLRAKASLSGDSDGVGGIVTAQMQILLDPNA